ncbi:MAG: hypothetical protein H6970_14545 [Gammaproteobacteria bacterium]|nr:hypothetical protein [Gammaproteobacteria bacterium]MCP5426263.1 hypothetical protein [Gammaproteobacteria bacterium]
MKYWGPKAVPPRNGWDWLRQGVLLLMHRPAVFIAIALLAPAGSLVLVNLPVWTWFTGPSGWLAVVSNLICYGLPLTCTVSLACGFARVVNQERLPRWSQVLNPTAGRVLTNASLFLFALLLQGYLVAYLLRGLVAPQVLSAFSDAIFSPADPSFGMAESLLATQLGLLGGLLVVFQFLGACFVLPLHLFRELPLQVSWRQSFLAVQLNPWLLPVLGLAGVALLLLSFSKTLSVVAQILALPLPVLLGVVLYLAWLDLFQGGEESAMPDSEAPA